MQANRRPELSFGSVTYAPQQPQISFGNGLHRIGKPGRELLEHAFRGAVGFDGPATPSLMAPRAPENVGTRLNTFA